ncbi:ABC transporter permease [Geomonas ferrireducens]|uniref:ABC transporter permease n=1 Tax=Geomonas ferrireducens TaxID=2570227 RepID=UPI0010A91E74|nr:ABC transporter permease [Geomonas ferrireducens]
MQHLRQFLIFIKELFRNRHLIAELTKADFRQKYLGSYLGIFWAFVHPTIYILILWFVFQVGFKSKPIEDFPFILWMLTAITPWLFFSECLQNTTNCIIENSFLVKKMAFSIGVLPIIKILSALIIHIFFVLAIFVIFLIYGYTPSLYNLQVIYYIFATVVLILGLSWLTSSLILFLKDVGQLIMMLLQFGFWMTPIFWSAKNLPQKYLSIIKLNPMYYIIEGYRQSFIYKTFFWETDLPYTIYFWCFTLFFFFAGGVIFRRLRPHFADVL